MANNLWNSGGRFYRTRKKDSIGPLSRFNIVGTSKDIHTTPSCTVWHKCCMHRRGNCWRKSAGRASGRDCRHRPPPPLLSVVKRGTVRPIRASWRSGGKRQYWSWSVRIARESSSGITMRPITLTEARESTRGKKSPMRCDHNHEIIAIINDCCILFLFLINIHTQA